MPEQWYDRRANVARLVEWAANEGHTASELARLVEKPWNYTDEHAALVVPSPDDGSVS